MNVIVAQTLQRVERLCTVENLLKKIKEKKREVDMSAFVIHVCERFGCSDRTAKEYIKIAQSRL